MFRDVLETTTHNQEFSDQLDKEEATKATESVGDGEFHGGYGSASLRECLERIAPQEPTTSAALHSGAGVRTNPSQMTNPPQVMSLNMENQSQETTPMKDPPPDDASLRPKTRKRTEEDLTPKSEQAEVKEEQEEEEPTEEVPTIQIRAPDWFYSTIWLEHDPNARPN